MKTLLFLTSSLLAASPALAQSCQQSDPDCIVLADPIRDELITVVATGTAGRVADSGQSISVIGAAEIAAVQGPDLLRVLERLPGVIAARSGPLGSQTSLFVRGANSQQLVVTLDGVRLADVAAPSGGFDLGTLLTGGIDKIELLRGSNSVVWGSDAMGGVLALTSAEFDGARTGIEYGANDTFSANATLGRAGPGYALTASAGRVRSRGISAFARGTEPDGFRQSYASLRGRIDLGQDVTFVAAGRYADSRVDFDGFPPPTYTFADTPEYQTTRQGSGRVGLDYAGRSLALKLGLAYSDTRRGYFDDATSTAPNFATTGQSWRADFSGKADLADALTLNFGADSEWTRFSTSFDPRQTARLSSAHALLGYHAGVLHLSAGIRADDHDRFGTHWTFGANGTVALAADLRLRASYGEGFKAPTLYQLYGYGGNLQLRPETSRAYEAGLEQGLPGGSHLAVTLFRRDSRDLIDYRYPTGYFNTGRTRAEGLELEAGWALTGNLRARAVYSHLTATDRTSGKDLPRRPHDTVSAGLDWNVAGSGVQLGADLRLAGQSFDDSANTLRLGGYGVLTLRASVPLGDRYELYGRIENVTDARYQTVADYGTYRRSAFVGVRTRW